MKYLHLPKLLLITIFSCFAVMAMAQEVIITGVVTDKETGQPIEGVTVRVKNSTTGTATDASGKYKIKAPSAESVITFTYTGYAVFERKAGNTGSVDVAITKSDALLDDVVVVGYGTKKRLNVLGSVAAIKGEDIEDIPVSSLGSALINRLPGVGVNFASGKPGSTTTINIRNSTTFAGAAAVGVTADPLYVIDNIIVTKQDFDNLDASMVESITFLKDASAAIYGAAGAKGVVLVTTKKGKPGKPKISYSGYFGINDAAVKPELMTAYEHAKMLNDGYELNNAALNSRFSQADLDSLRNSPQTWWYKELWSPSTVNRHTINISGGTERLTFFAGGNVYNETGNYGNISLNKYGLRAGFNAKVTPEVNATVTVSTDYSKNERGTLKGASDETDDQQFRGLLLTPQWVPLTINGLPVRWNGPNPPGAWSPVALDNANNYKWQKSQGINLNASLEYKPNFLPGLTGRFQFGQVNRNSNHREYFPPYRAYNFVMRGQNNLLFSNVVASTTTVSNSDQLGQSTTRASSYQMIASVAYAKKFKHADFDVFVAMDQSEGSSENVFFYKNGQTIAGTDEFWAFSNAGQTIRNPEIAETAKRSYLGRLNYNLLGKYFLEVIARYDASSNFAPENRWGLFPSVGLGWKISDEKFFRKYITFLNTMKVRANYGIVGEDRVKARLYESRFTVATGGALIGTTSTNGLDPNIYPNPDITWEKSRTLNVGFDATALNNKLTVSADFFHRYTYDAYDQLTSGLPATFGAPASVVNNARIITWGSEFSVGYRGRINRDWSYSADVNFGFGNSMVLQSFFNTNNLGVYGTNELDIAAGRDPRKYNSSNYGYIALGILKTQAEVDALLAKNPNYRIGGQKPQVGFMNFKDINGDGAIDDNDIVPMFDRTTAFTTFGITLGANYKAFKLSTNIVLRVGGKVFYDGEARKVPTTTQNAPAFWNDHWTPENPDAKFPRADAPLARENSTFWALNGTTCRINNMTLSYALPKSLADKLKIPDLRVLLTGTNLWTIINPFKYKDPYTSNFANYPTLRTISIGVNATL